MLLNIAKPGACWRRFKPLSKHEVNDLTNLVVHSSIVLVGSTAHPGMAFGVVMVGRGSWLCLVWTGQPSLAPRDLLSVTHIAVMH